MWEFFIFTVAGLLVYQVYVHLYFKSEKFIAIKNSVEKYTTNCNDLNDHIEVLKSSYSDVSSLDYGDSSLSDDSKYKMKRSEWTMEQKSSRVYNCSASVCKSASNQPFKYLCKYFSIKVNEETLSKFENVLNDFSAAEQGKVLVKSERDAIVASLVNSIPKIIIKFERKRLFDELGFNKIDLSDLYFPVYTFQYISSGGNSSFKSGGFKHEVQHGIAIGETPLRAS